MESPKRKRPIAKTEYNAIDDYEHEHRCAEHEHEVKSEHLFIILHFRGSSSESKQVLKEGPQFGVVGSVRQSDQEFFTQHFSGN